MAFPFLDLPPEIRERICRLLCASSTPIPLSSAGDTEAEQHRKQDCDPTGDLPLHPLFPLSLLLTCHQLYHEARPLYFSTNSFSLLIQRSPLPFAYFLAHTFRDNRLRIRSLRLVFMRWGKKDFFVNTMVPLLQDMILNGSLRELEIRVRESHLLHYNLAVGKMEFITNEAVERLRGLLKDPYLERVVVRTYMPVYLGDEVDSFGDGDIYEDVSHLFERPSTVVSRQ